MDNQLNNIEVTEAQLAGSAAEIDDDGDHDNDRDAMRRERGKGVPPPIPTLAEALLSWR